MLWAQQYHLYKSILQTFTHVQKDMLCVRTFKNCCNRKKKKWKQPKYPSVVECLTTSVCVHSMKFMWSLQIMMWINGFESVAENCRAVVVNFLRGQNHLGR